MIKKETRRTGIARRVLIIFTLVFISASLLFGGLFYYLYRENVRETISNEMKINVDVMNGYISLMLNNAHIIAEIIIPNSYVQSFPQTAASLDLIEMRTFYEYLRSIAMSNPSIANIDIFFTGPNTVITSDYGVTSRLNETTLAWFRSLADLPLFFFTDQYRPNIDQFNARTQNHITLVRPLHHLGTGEKLGFVAVSIEARAIRNILNSSENIQNVIINSDSRVLLNSAVDLGFAEETVLQNLPLNNESFTGRKNGQAFISVYSRLPQTDWILASFAMTDDLFQGGRMMFNYLVLILAMNLVLILAAITINWNSVLKRLGILLTLMGRVQGGDLSVSYDDTRNDEFSNIFTSFNTMVFRLKQLFEENDKLRSLHKDVQLSLMQAQINPHFIYNIFNNMNWMLELRRYRDLESLVDAVAVYYRKSLNNGDLLITVRDMLENIESYLKIQKIRFSDRLDYELDFDPRLNEVKILNHLLLPLVENAVIHGAEQSLRKCTVWINGFVSGSELVMRVTDSGAGISAEKLKSILDVLKTQGGRTTDYFALDNVNQRIKLHYGQAYGLDLTSLEGRRTTVTVTLPYPISAGQGE